MWKNQRDRNYEWNGFVRDKLQKLIRVKDTLITINVVLNILCALKHIVYTLLKHIMYIDVGIRQN